MVNRRKEIRLVTFGTGRGRYHNLWGEGLPSRTVMPNEHPRVGGCSLLRLLRSHMNFAAATVFQDDRGGRALLLVQVR